MIARAQVAVPEYADEVVRGLTSAHKTLPCKLFYDDRGSAIFEEITRLPEYYPTRTELEILRDRSREIAQAVTQRGRARLPSQRPLKPGPY